jgi:hypothetical protein
MSTPTPRNRALRDPDIGRTAADIDMATRA